MRSALRAWQSQRGQRNTEFEQACVRIVLGSLLLGYFGYQQSSHPLSDAKIIHVDIVTALSVFLAASVAISVSLLYWRGQSPMRRVCAILLDVGTLSYVLLIGDKHSAPLYFLYLWIIIGYGFRFGRLYLFIALTMTLTGFAAVIVLSPYWQNELQLSFGLWGGTLVLSIYFSFLVGRLFRALDQADVANVAKRQFICAVSHELRTPLNAMIGMLDLLKTRDMGREQQEMIDCMTTTSQMMLAQIDDVLDFSRIEAGKMQIEHLDFDLYELLHAMLAVFRFRVDPRAIEMVSWIGPDLPVRLNGDPHHLRQILMNLLSNAVKFTEQGHIRLSVFPLGACDDHRIRLLFSVSDTGIGIPEAVQGRIFDSFTQADESTARRYGGSGLGTTICKQLVELMEGKIGFSSEPGAGSEFWFELPFVRASSDGFDANTVRSEIRCLIVGELANRSRLPAALARMCFSPPLHAVDDHEACGLLEQAGLHGQPVGLLFIRQAPESGEDADSYARRLRKTVRRLSEASANPCIGAVLLLPDGLSDDHASASARSSGCFSLLVPDADEALLSRLLHWSRLANQERERMTELRTDLTVSPLTVAERSLAPLPAAPAPTGYKVLIVEDNPTNRRVLQKILERAGHSCTLAKNGEEALDMVGIGTFDAIVLDMSMPGIQGVEVARVCRLMGGAASRVPIIMFSANVTAEARDESFQAGANLFMPKPIQVGPFLKALQDLVEGQRPATAAAVAPETTSWSLQPASPDQEAPVLDLANLSALEGVSRDPTFLDELIAEYIEESQRLLRVLEQGLVSGSIEPVKEALHALRGSALSVGATAFKLTCRRAEQLSQPDMIASRFQLLGDLKQRFGELLAELDRYRQQRLRKHAPGPD